MASFLIPCASLSGGPSPRKARRKNMDETILVLILPILLIKAEKEKR